MGASGSHWPPESLSLMAAMENCELVGGAASESQSNSKQGARGEHGTGVRSGSPWPAAPRTGPR